MRHNVEDVKGLFLFLLFESQIVMSSLLNPFNSSEVQIIF